MLMSEKVLCFSRLRQAILNELANMAMVVLFFAMDCGAGVGWRYTE
jgi:hypothetical protein